MIRFSLILTIFAVTVYASGELTIINSPKSLTFKGNDALNADDLGDLTLAALGNPVSGDSKWAGLYITDPFHLPRNIIIIHLDGVNHTMLSSFNHKTYPIEGQGVQQSVNAVGTLLESEGENVCIMNLNNLEDSVSNLKNILGDDAVKLKTIAKTKYLNGQVYSGDKQFMQTLQLLDAMTSNINKLLDKCQYISVQLSVDLISKEHGAKSGAMIEALDLFTKSVQELAAAVQKSTNSQTLILRTTTKDEVYTRVKRQEDDVQIYNLAAHYSEDYPAIFNIILWFMVAFVFCLLAISYVIATMDPGRDSIIYRMTSTRMKKDN